MTGPGGGRWPWRARSVSTTAITAAVILLCGPAAASPLDLFGFGGRSPGMAGTGVASATDYDAAWINPAGLAEVERKRITFGFMYADFALEQNQRDTNTESVAGMVFGGAVPIPLGGVLKDRIGLGIGFHVPPKAINRARAPAPGVPVFALLETRGHVVGVQASLGVRVTDRLNFGLGAQTLATLDGGIHVSTDSAGRFTTRSEQELVTRFAPLVGMRLRLDSISSTLGVTFRGESRTDYQIVVTNDLINSLPLTIPTLVIGGTSQFDPLTVAVELAWSPRQDLQVNAQLAYQNWSAFSLPTVTPVRDRPPQEAPGFHDSVMPRVAAEWTVFRDDTSALLLRGGYFFAPTPAPEMSGRQSLLDNGRHVLTAGLGAYLPGTRAPVHLNLWVQSHLLVPRTHVKDLSIYEPGERVPFFLMKTRGRILVGGLSVGIDI